MIPHITDEIKRRIFAAAEGYDIAIGEVGGTVGDIEGLPFLEAVRQVAWDLGRENVLYIHLTLVPYITGGGELKTKPTQHSVKELTGLGIQPDILLCRTDRMLDKKIKTKIAHFCNVAENSVITAKDVEWIYEVPLVFHDEGLDERIVEKLNIWTGAPHLERWQKVVDVLKNPKDSVRIAVVGKYMSLKESYKSLFEALVHGGIANERESRARLHRSGADRAGSRGDLARKMSTGFLFPAVSATAAARERSPRSAMPARTTFRFSAFASACRWRWSSLRATFAAWSAPTPRNSICRRPIR